jgi:hypothetical protein
VAGSGVTDNAALLMQGGTGDFHHVTTSYLDKKLIIGTTDIPITFAVCYMNLLSAGRRILCPRSDGTARAYDGSSKRARRQRDATSTTSPARTLESTGNVSPRASSCESQPTQWTAVENTRTMRTFLQNGFPRQTSRTYLQPRSATCPWTRPS